jgi:hypothetical protein
MAHMGTFHPDPLGSRERERERERQSEVEVGIIFRV